MSTTILPNDINTSCFDGYTKKFSASRHQRILDLRPWEPDISAVIAALIHDAGVAATSFLCLAAGHTPDRSRYDYLIVDASDLPRAALRRRRTDGGRCQIRPDIFVTRTEKGTGIEQIVVAVELKLNAWTNYVDCPAGLHVDYSNQLVCYPEGCWQNLDHPAAADVRYVWLAPRAHMAKAYIESKALRDDPETLERLYATPPAYLRQEVAWSTAWRKATLEDLAASIAPHAPGVAELIRHWMAT